MKEKIIEFLAHHSIEIFWAVVFAFIAGIVVELIFKPFHRRKKKINALKAIYSFTGKSTSLKPVDVLGNRPFNKDYYYERDEDGSIYEGLKNGKNVLIVGPSLSGKTRAAYQTLTELNEPQDVAIPICKDINQETFQFPKNTRIIFIDDLHRFVEQKDFGHLFTASIKSNITIIATCRSEMEYKRAKNKMDLETTFEKIIELPKISPEKGKEIADEVNKGWDDVKFDGTVGSIFMPLEEMERRFNNCNKKDEKPILWVLRNLYICGIYEENQVFPLDWIKIAAKEGGLEGTDFDWSGWFEGLKDKEFITLVKTDKVQAEEVYLEHIVKPPSEEKILDVFEEAITTFLVIPDALLRLGLRASDIGNIDLEKARYKKIAIKAYEKALKVWTLKSHPMDYAITRNNLGIAYKTLAEVEAKAENCKKAIRACEEALKVYTLDRFPMDYAMTQNNLGNAYRTLAEVKDKAVNCKEAIRAYEEALKVYKLDRLPMQHATTQNNLGTAYTTLAEVEVEAEKKAENCKKAIRAYEEALKVYTLEHSRTDYAKIQMNLGTACGELAKVEDTAENCNKAVKAYEEALKVYTLDRLPIQHAMIQWGFGFAYRTLAEVEDKVENCKKAIESCKEALKVYTLECFPMQYANTQWCFGAAYSTLAEVEDKPENCKKAIRAFEEALKVFTEEEFPEVYPRVAGNLRILLDFMGEGGESPVGQ